MLTEYIAAHPIHPVAKPQFEGLRERIAPHDLADIIALAEAWRGRPWPMLTAGMYADYIRTGSRKSCENPYFDRRRKLIAAFLHVWATGETADLPQVEDGLLLLCEETAWAISAHANLSREHPFPDALGTPIVDLFAAQTGMVVSFIVQLMADALHADIAARVKSEVARRILVPFMENDGEWWMGFYRKNLNNWTPWIVSNVLMAANVWDHRLDVLIPRACGMLDRWLSCVPEDGGCDEGAAYWNMAGGAFLDCLMLLESTCGIDLWGDEKVRAMMAYPERVYLQNGWFANFADCDARPFISGERLQYAGLKTGNAALIRMGAGMWGDIGREISDVPHLSRLLMHLDAAPVPVQAESAAAKDVYLPDLQLRIVEKGDYVLACKGGHNAESHNHNDVGSFLLMAEGSMQAVDAGNVVYTAKTFSDRRYELWNCRAAYHSVPMIGEFEQREGIAHAAREVECLPDGLALNMAGAYPQEAKVTSLHRCMTLGKGGLTVSDDIALEEAQRVTWVLMLRDEPILTESGSRGRETGFEIIWGDGLSARIERLDVTDDRLKKSYPGTLWRLLLTDAPDTYHHRTIMLRAKEKKHA